MTEIKTDENASGALYQDRTDGISCVSSSRATWRNLDGLSLIQRLRLNRKDSHWHVLSEPLIEDEMSDRTVMPKFTINSNVF